MTRQKGKKILKLSKEDRAYIAGIIDGEGCITISRKLSCDGTKGGIQYRLYVQVANTNVDLINFLKTVTGLGNVGYGESKNKKHKPYYRWGLWSIQATQLLRQITPHLVVKHRQAMLGIKFIEAKRDCVGRNGLSKREWAFQKNCHKLMSELNKRGR
jgi:hypothetical protein